MSDNREITISKRHYDDLCHLANEGQKALRLRDRLLDVLSSNGNADGDIIKYFTETESQND